MTDMHDGISLLFSTEIILLQIESKQLDAAFAISLLPSLHSLSRH